MTANHQSIRTNQQLPPPVAKKPSVRQQQLHSALTKDANDGHWAVGNSGDEIGFHGNGGLHENPQKLKSSKLREQQTSPWLDQQLQASRSSQRRRDSKNFDDNIRQQLEEELDDLKAENRAKNRELDANKWIENEMNRKLRSADDAYMLRHLIKDKERQIVNQEKIIADLTEDNSRLAEDIGDKERQIFQLQSEVDNLDRVIVSKNALKETERLEAVSDELDRTKDQLATAELDMEAAKAELKNLNNSLHRKERELRTKNEQLDNLAKELRDAKQNSASLENEKVVAENHQRESDRHNKALQDQVEKLVDYRERCHNLEEENSYMAEAIRALEAKIFQLETTKKDKEALEDLVHDLKVALKDKNKVLKDRRDLMMETQQLKDLLREKSADEVGLQQELGKLKDVLNELERENDFYRELENDFHRVKTKYEELEKEKFKHELIIAKLRPKVEKLQKRCKEKDDLIRRLANELRGGSDRLPRELLQEADRNQRKTLDDYVDPADYMDSQEPLADEIKKSRGRQRSPQAAYEPNWRFGEPGRTPQPVSDQPHAPTDRHVFRQPTPPDSPIDPERVFGLSDSPPLPRRGRGAKGEDPRGRTSSASPPIRPAQHSRYETPPWDAEDKIQPVQHQRAQSNPYSHEPRLDSNPYRYDPRLDSRPTKDGPQLDSNPHRNDPRLDSNPHRNDPRLDSNPHRNDPRLDSNPSKQPESELARHQPSKTWPQDAPSDAYEPTSRKHRQLDAPLNFRISRVLADGSILLEWEAPKLDSLDRNNGIVVAGYQLFINDIEEQKVVSSRLTKSLIPKSSIGQMDTIAVQTFGYDGEVSEKVEIPARATNDTAAEPATGGGQRRRRSRDSGRKPRSSQQPLSVDVSPKPQIDRSMPDTIGHRAAEPEVAHRKAVRDYFPSQQSPSAFPSYELDLRAGDDVQTFGPVRPDGMFNAQIQGRRGLVPAQYLQLID